MGDGAKEEFLRDFGEHYGYPKGPKSIDQIRATEFKRLQFQGHARTSHWLSSFKRYQHDKVISIILCFVLFIFVFFLLLQILSTWTMLGQLYTLTCKWNQFSTISPVTYMEILVS